MLRATLQHILTGKRRLAGVGLAIMLSIAFLSASLLTGDTLREGFRNTVGSEYQHIDLEVRTLDREMTTDDLTAIAGISGITEVHPDASFWTTATANGRSTDINIGPLPDAGVLRDGLDMKEGRLPENPGEITLPTSRIAAFRIELGDTVTVSVPSPTADGWDTVEREFVVVGAWNGDGRYGSAGLTAFLDADDWATWEASYGTSGAWVLTDTNINPAILTTELEDTLQTPVQVTDRSQLIDAQVAEREDQWKIIELGVTAFAILTLIVAGIVISNTFSILIAQRTRDIALFRCAGATASQVRRMVLIEASLVGAVASAIGVALAWVLASIGLRLADARFDLDGIPATASLSPSDIAIALVAGLILAIAAAWLPSQAATRIDPLQALRISQSPVGAGQRTSAIRVAASLAPLAMGAALLLGGMLLASRGEVGFGVMVGMLGGMVSFLGVLVGASVIVPPVAHMLGSASSAFGGVPARVAASNSARNPRRTTGTAMALVIGVALVTMMSVGAESLKVSLGGAVDAEVPLDLQIRPMADNQQEQFADFADELPAIEGVAAVARVNHVEASIDTGNGENVMILLSLADPNEVRAALHDDDSIFVPRPGQVVLPDWATEMAGVDSGDTVSIVVNGSPVQLTVVEMEGSGPTLAAASDFPAAEGELQEVWVQLADGSDSTTVLNAVYLQADESGAMVDIMEATAYRDTLNSALDAMLLVATGLLAVAVIIAIIGVSNTLTLSVIERTQESALLRALGFTRRQLRTSLAVEGVLLALIGSSIGLVLGAIYGVIGTYTIVGDTMDVAIAMPWSRIGIIVVAAIACGVIASVLPSKRAAQADPATALAPV